jgi:hypothetical protein
LRELSAGPGVEHETAAGEKRFENIPGGGVEWDGSVASAFQRFYPQPLVFVVNV